MPREQQKILATNNLINAIFAQNHEQIEHAIENGADINCRVIKVDGKYRIATDDDLITIERDNHVLPFANTTTLLNILARGEIKDSDHQIARILMEHGAQLDAIDYASYWTAWGNHPVNYFQNTPLLNAIANNNLGFALLYMDFLDNLPENDRKQILDYKDKFIDGEHSALEFAIRRGFSGLAMRIVKAGANVNPTPFKYAQDATPLHMACMILGQSRVSQGNKWDDELGSDLELILTLLEYNADFTIQVPTDIYTGQTNGWFQSNVTAFDHIDISQGEVNSRIFNYIQACNAPAMFPKQVGQINHCFHDEESFLCPRAQELKEQQSRAKYLKSKQFQKTDKIILQKAILKRIINHYLSIYEDNEIRQIDLDRLTVDEIIARLVNHYQGDWFFVMMQYGGIFYNSNKESADDVLLPEEIQDEIASEQVEDETRLEASNNTTVEGSIEARVNNPSNEILQNQPISSSFLINVLSHPYAKIAGLILIVAGLGVAIVGTCGIAGIAVGISALVSKILLTSGASSVVVGGAGFFIKSKIAQDNQDNIDTLESNPDNPDNNLR